MKNVAAVCSEEKIHVVLDNASPHLSVETVKWLDKQNGRFVFHFTPTSASWMDEVEIWNGTFLGK